MESRDKISNKASLRVPFLSSFLLTAMDFAEKGARAFGYADREVGGLMLATEELFSFYLDQAAPGSALEIGLEDQGYRMVLSITFRAADPDMRPFNLTWHVSQDSEESLDTLGPMIAARSVSSLRLEFADQEQVTIRLTRDRDYPKAAVVSLPSAQDIRALRVVEPSREELFHFSAMVSVSVQTGLPSFMTCPGKAADMLKAGALNALLVRSGEWIVGGVLWRPVSESCLELFGPYCFGGDPGNVIMALLLDETISRVTRTRYRGLLRRQGALAGYERFFDYLGAVRMNGVLGDGERQVYYFRQLMEEAGAAVYCRGRLTGFLQDHYERLSLPRQLRESPIDLRRLSSSSVLTVDLDYPRSSALIRPLRPGQDMEENLRGHLRLLADQGIVNILMEINAARVDEIAFCEALEETGFWPRLLIPDAVQGDVLVYSLADPDEKS